MKKKDREREKHRQTTDRPKQQGNSSSSNRNRTEPRSKSRERKKDTKIRRIHTSAVSGPICCERYLSRKHSTAPHSTHTHTLACTQTHTHMHTLKTKTTRYTWTHETTSDRSLTILLIHFTSPKTFAGETHLFYHFPNKNNKRHIHTFHTESYTPPYTHIQRVVCTIFSRYPLEFFGRYTQHSRLSLHFESGFWLENMLIFWFVIERRF